MVGLTSNYLHTIDHSNGASCNLVSLSWLVLKSISPSLLKKSHRHTWRIWSPESLSVISSKLHLFIPLGQGILKNQLFTPFLFFFLFSIKWFLSIYKEFMLINFKNTLVQKSLGSWQSWLLHSTSHQHLSRSTAVALVHYYELCITGRLVLGMEKVWHVRLKLNIEKASSSRRESKKDASFLPVSLEASSCISLHKGIRLSQHGNEHGIHHTWLHPSLLVVLQGSLSSLQKRLSDQHLSVDLAVFFHAPFMIFGWVEPTLNPQGCH